MDSGSNLDSAPCHLDPLTRPSELRIRPYKPPRNNIQIVLLMRNDSAQCDSIVFVVFSRGPFQGPIAAQGLKARIPEKPRRRAAFFLLGRHGLGRGTRWRKEQEFDKNPTSSYPEGRASMKTLQSSISYSDRKHLFGGSGRSKST